MDVRNARTSGEGAIAVNLSATSAPRLKKTKSYADVVEAYFDAKLVGLRSGHKARQRLQRVGRLYGWNPRPIALITDDDAATMLHDIAWRGIRAGHIRMHPRAW